MHGNIKKVNIKKLFDILRMTFLIAAVVFSILQIDTAYAAEASVKEDLKKEVTDIVNSRTGAKDSASVKMKKLFKYAEKYNYGRTMGFKAEKSWTRTYALDMYRQKKGSCYHYAAAYAYLVKQATGYSVRVVTGETDSNPHHAWTEVKIGNKWYICDSNRDKFEANSSGKYYMKKKNSKAMKKAYNNYKNAVYYKIRL